MNPLSFLRRLAPGAKSGFKDLWKSLFNSILTMILDHCKDFVAGYIDRMQQQLAKQAGGDPAPDDGQSVGNEVAPAPPGNKIP